MANLAATNAMSCDQVAMDNSESGSFQSNEVRLLKYGWIHTMKMRKFNILKDSLTSTNPMMNTIGLQGIGQKIDNYKNCDEFLADIDALVRSYSLKFLAQPDAREVVDELAELCHRNVKSIRTCAECFQYWAEDSQNYFTKVCTKPHLLVYAKALGSKKFWPAKAMAVNGNMVNVEYFGDHTQDDIPAAKCILYTRHSTQFKKSTPFNDAILELDVHIKNIEEKFGELSPATAKITIDPKNVEKQRMAMFPRAFNRSEDDQRVASNKAQLNFNTIGESSSNAATSNDTPSNDELNESRMQEGGLDHSRRGRLGQKRQADGIHPLRDNEKSSSTKKIATNCDNVTSTTK